MSEKTRTRGANDDGALRALLRRALGIVALAVWALAAHPGPAQAALYKWVDDKGIVHYTDQVPPDEVNKGNVQLSPQGVPIRKTDPAISPEQRKAHDAAQERQRETAKQQEEGARRDKALLDSYTNEADIDLAKTRAIRTIQGTLQSAMAYSAQLTKRKAALNERRATYVGKPVPSDIDRDIAAIDAELARQSETIAQKNKQLVEVSARYDADKARWEALRGTPGGPLAPAPPPAASAVPVPGAAPAASPGSIKK